MSAPRVLRVCRMAPAPTRASNLTSISERAVFCTLAAALPRYVICGLIPFSAAMRQRQRFGFQISASFRTKLGSSGSPDKRIGRFRIFTGWPVR